MVLEYLVRKPNRVLEKQRYYQNDRRPIYFRPPRAKVFMGTWFAGLALGIIGVTYGAYEMVKGKSTEA